MCVYRYGPQTKSHGKHLQNFKSYIPLHTHNPIKLLRTCAEAIFLLLYREKTSRGIEIALNARGRCLSEDLGWMLGRGVVTECKWETETVLASSLLLPYLLLTSRLRASAGKHHGQTSALRPETDNSWSQTCTVHH